MRALNRLLVLVAMIALPGSAVAAPIIIDFEGIAPFNGATNENGTRIFGNGTFTSTHGHIYDSVLNAGHSTLTDNGTDWYVHDNNTPFIVDTLDSSNFTLTSVDLADYTSKGGSFNPVSVLVTGFYAAGGTTSVVFNITTPGFSTFTFGPGWAGLTQATFDRNGSVYPGFDNIVLNGETGGVPAPGALALLGIGLLAMGARRKPA